MKTRKCKCSYECEKFPTLGYAGYYFSHAPEAVKEKVQSLRDKKVAEKKIRQLAYVSGAHKKPTEVPENKEKFKLRSELLKMADNVFSKYVRKRDLDERGFVKCPCCNNRFSPFDKDDDNKPIVQALHFISRGNFHTRYDERFVRAGCSRCNQKMHYDPTGKEAASFRRFLVGLYGEDVVADAEKKKRNVIKFTEADIRSIIEKYRVWLQK